MTRQEITEVMNRVRGMLMHLSALTGDETKKCCHDTVSDLDAVERAIESSNIGSKETLFITLTTYGSGRPTKVRPESITAIVENEWGCNLYLEDNHCISVTETAEEICKLILDN